MPISAFDDLARRYSRQIDLLVAMGMAASITGLFLLDVTAPRGEVDGIGYAAVVALGARFGTRVIVACAVLTTVLTLLGSLLVPDAGISVAGMWANRGFAILETWIIAAVLTHRLRLEAYVTGRDRKLQANQAMLGRIVRHALLTDQLPEERLHRLTELAAEALQADFCLVFQRPLSDGPIHVADMWDRRRRRHSRIETVPEIDRESYNRAVGNDHAIVADDIRESAFHRPRRAFFESIGIRAMMSANTVQSPGRGAVSIAFAEPHHWTDQEIAFGRSVANLASLALAISRNAQTLAALDQVGEGIFIEDRNGDVLYANRAAADLSGGTASSGFLRPEIALSGASDLHELSWRGRDLEIQRLRLPDEGILFRINDVTARNGVLAERQKLQERLQRGAKMEAIGQLAGGVAHDFNNILGAILGFAGFLRQDLPEKSPQHGFAERIYNACERGRALVEQIMAFAKVRAAERGVVDLGLLVERCREDLMGLTPTCVHVEVKAGGQALPVLGNGVQVAQLITNLFINARDAVLPGGGTITLTARAAAETEIEDLRHAGEGASEHIWGEILPDRPYGLFRVEDDGAGIPPHILERIFEPFFTTKGRLHGTGLGLAVVHGVVESLGGACHVRSRPGEGTVFTIWLPLMTGVAELPVSQDAPATSPGCEHILIVDDEADVADMLCIGLERLGYQPVSVNSPLEALQAFAEAPQAFDIVITDQVMPGLRGLDLIRRLKEIRPDLLTLLCTGYSDGANEDVARQAGVDAFFQKPVDAAQIAASLRRLVAQRSAASRPGIG